MTKLQIRQSKGKTAPEVTRRTSAPGEELAGKGKRRKGKRSRKEQPKKRRKA